MILHAVPKRKDAGFRVPGLQTMHFWVCSEMGYRFKIRKTVLCGFLAACVLLSCMPYAHAEGETAPLIDAEELQSRVDAYFSQMGILPELVSVGYVYTPTGECWYHNADKWYYSASLYKVPLMMLLAEREAAGELTQESLLYSWPLSLVEEEVLTNSNNDIAYSVMLSIAEPFACRSMFQRYSAIPEEEYPWEFASYSYFSARFMTDVMKTLFSEPERFPHVADCLKQAQPGHYFHLVLGDDVPIAQKYGYYHDDEDGSDWTHTAGIFYTPNPFILTVMTRYGGMGESIIGDLGALFFDYTGELDKRLEQREEKAAEPASQTAAPAEGLQPGIPKHGRNR